jgi:hypothetical protein
MRAAFLALILLATTASAAHAGRVTYGSDLSAAAAIAHSTPNDSAFFNDVVAGGNGPVAKVTGQVIQVSVKGRIVATPGAGNPFNTVHFQVLRPKGDGRYQVPDGATSTDYSMPWAGSDDQVTTFNTTKPYDALCVRPGDRVDLATLGGYDANGYPNGTPFKVFGSAPGSRVLHYAASGTGSISNGQTFRPQQTYSDQELLMRFVVGTGEDARPACRGATQSPATSGPLVTLPPQGPHLRRDWVLSVAAYCHKNRGSCRGRLTARVKGTTIGSAGYTIAGKDTEGVRFRFNSEGRRLFKRSGGRLRVRVTAVTGGTKDSRTLVVRRA